MELINEYRTDIAYAVLRLILGILFVVQGYDKLFVMGLRDTEKGMDRAMMNTHLSKSLVNTVTIISSVMEFAGGLLLLFGFLTVPALLILAADLVIVAVGMSLREPLWDMRHFWPRLVMIIVLLLLPLDHDRLSIDHFISPHVTTIVAG